MNMIEKRKAMAGQGGFTLIELLVVIAILAVLGGAAIIGIGAMRSNATEQVCRVDAKTLKTAGHAFAIENPGTAVAAGDDGSGLGDYIEEPVTSGPTVGITAAGVVTVDDSMC